MGRTNENEGEFIFQAHEQIYLLCEYDDTISSGAIGDAMENSIAEKEIKGEVYHICQFLITNIQTIEKQKFHLNSEDK